jgi:alpha-1,2-mannosyltransferase
VVGGRPSRAGHHLWHGPGLVRRAIHGGRRAPLTSVLGLLIVVAAVGPLMWPRIYADYGHRMIDLSVYRSAGQSLLLGRPIYDYLTPVPQLLPFTYPPFAAVLAVPLAVIPPSLADWIWNLGTLAVLGWLVLVAFRPLIRRFPPTYRPIVFAVLLSAMAWTMPVRDCLRYGQVGIFLTALCVLDCISPKTRWPRGMLIGFAVAVKLTPGVFIPYLWLTGRRRAAVVATAWTLGFSAAGLIAMPSASKEFWTSAVFDSGRLGSNSGTSNQSLRSIFLRWLPGHLGALLWVVSVLVVAVYGYRKARDVSTSGHELDAVALVGMLQVLLSPVAWIHHLAGFVPLAVGAMVADGRRRWYVLAGVLTTVFFTLEIPWWGQALLGHHHSWHFFDRLLQDSYTFGALFALWLLGRMGLSDRVRTTSTGHDEPMSR